MVVAINDLIPCTHTRPSGSFVSKPALIYMDLLSLLSSCFARENFIILSLDPYTSIYYSDMPFYLYIIFDTPSVFKAINTRQEKELFVWSNLPLTERSYLTGCISTNEIPMQ